MDIPQARIDRIIAALDRGLLPRLLKSQKYVLQLAPGAHSSKIVLVNHNGATTEGEFVFDLLGRSIPTDLQFDLSQQPVVRGPNKYAKRIDGKEVRVATLENGQWRLLSAGRLWAQNERADVVVRIPALIHGSNDKGVDYVRDEDYCLVTSKMFPVLSSIAVNSNYTRQQRDDLIKAEIIRYYRQRDNGREDFFIQELSQEVWRYDASPERTWQISIDLMRPTAAGPSQSLILNQPMGVLRTQSSVPYPNHVLEVCLIDHADHLCVPRALAVLLKQPLDIIANSFDFQFGARWRSVGITSNQLLEWCSVEGRNAYVTWKDISNWKVKSQTSPDNPNRSVAWATAGNHCYLYKDAHLLASQVDNLDSVFDLRAESEPRVKSVFTKEENDAPPVAEWKSFAQFDEGDDQIVYDVKPGYFYHADLFELRKWLCVEKHPHKVHWDGTRKYTKLVVECFVDTEKGPCFIGLCHIRHLPKDAEIIQKWLDRLHELTGVHIPWQGEGLPNLTLTVFQTLLRGQRRTPTIQEKDAIRALQNHLCAFCKTAPIEEFDHVKPVAASFRSDPQEEIQGLCKSCHRFVTQYQSDRTSIESQLSPYACRVYRDSPKAPGLTFAPNADQDKERRETILEKSRVIIDIRRCRFNAMAHYDLQTFPRFHVLDSIEPFDETNPKLGDLNYIDAPPGKCILDSKPSILTTLPLIGPMWYSELQARHALAQGQIQWSDVKATYRATGRIPRESVEVVLDWMLAAWGEGEKEEKLAKFSWNAAVGIMIGDYLTQTRVVTTTAEMPSYGSKLSEFVYDREENKVFDHITEVPLVSCRSFRPLWDCIMGWEYVKVACLVIAAENLSIPRRSILELQGDSMLLANVSRKSSEVKRFVDLSYEDVGRLSHLPRGFARYKRAHPAVSYPIRQGDDDKVFQQKRAKHNVWNTDVPRSWSFVPLPKIWRDIPVPIENGRPDTTAVIRHVLGGKHIWIDGMGGAGKTVLGRELVRLLRASGRLVVVIAKTNSATRNFGGEGVHTADKFLQRHVLKGMGSLPDVLFVEEISMLNLQLWGHISTLFQAGSVRKCQLVLSGDLFQLRPPKDTWNGSPTAKYALRDSDLLFELAQGTRCYLDANMRSDPTIFNFCKSLRQPGADLQERLAAARELFKPTRRLPDHVLVMSHRKRMLRNEELNQLWKPADALRLELRPTRCGDETQPQAMYIWPGMKVCGHSQPCLKSQMYEVQSCDDQLVVLKSDQGLTNVPAARACEVFRMTFALTYMRAQGLTLSGVVVLADTNHPNFELEHLNMGVSRATSWKLLEIRDL